MADIQTAHQQVQQPVGPVVWILQRGEMHEGGEIIGVFLDRELGRGQFVTAAQRIHQSFGIDDIREDEDGAFRLEGGCDWLSLEPHKVTTALELEA
ncbi:hypothetical protein ACFV2X_38395 [Streptomyces sp. NPDC059679]|uniref:hypothetical protein n=1 Tax=Streptomyces sp. NPDC059679 TaxID=3346903 RepID=UPI0036C4669B